MPAFEKLIPYLEHMRRLHRLISVLNYDLETTCPKKAIGGEADLLNFYVSEYASISKDPAYIQAVKDCAKEDSLDPKQKILIRDLMEEINFMEKVSIEQYSAWQEDLHRSNEIWREARGKDDFAAWLPYWKKAMQAVREMAKIRQKEGQTLYETCLDQYEKGTTEASLNAVFGPLKEYLIKKVPEVLKKQKGYSLPPIRLYSEDQQRELALAVLKFIQYDMDGGAMRESAHPFSDFIALDDNRITCHYDEDWRSNLFTVIHEGGHCLQFQNWSREDYDHYVGRNATAAQCETHSRFYENMIGRSKEAAPHLKKLCIETLGQEIGEISDEDFHRLLSSCAPGLIRCDADELTYSLHVIIRYEIERDLVNGVIECEDVPAIWKKKYKDYLGVDVPNDQDGCMQDVHWTDGQVGYFPSYALGNIYGAQILHAMKKDLDFDGLLGKGDLAPILSWLTEKDFAYDWLDPEPWIETVTGEKMNPAYYIEYLEAKF